MTRRLDVPSDDTTADHVGLHPREQAGQRSPAGAPVEIRVMVDYGGEFERQEPEPGASVVITRNEKTAAQGVTNREGAYRVTLPSGAAFSLGQTYKTEVTLRPKPR